jgi:hypothetical protein
VIGDEDVITLIGAVQDNAQRLGLIWTLTPGTVTAASPLAVRLDSPSGDAEVAIPVVSLIGMLGAGARVMVVSVPPAGQYIIGRISGVGRGVIGANATNNGSVATATSATPVPISSASWDSEPNFLFRSGYVYKVTFAGGVATAGGTAMFGTIQVRKGSASAVGTLLCNWPDGIPAGFNNIVLTRTFVSFIKNSTPIDVKTQLSVCAVRGTAASTYVLYGDAVQPLWLEVEELGLSVDFPGEAVLAISV